MNNSIKKELTLDSREVAEMVGKRHDHLIRDIETYVKYLSDPKIGETENTADAKMLLLEFFIPSTYIDAQGKERPNYQITKKGCEFIAHKLTGQKGALFTATYINRFHEMEQMLLESKPRTISDDTKAKELEIKLKNARVREANVYLKIADRINIPEYQQVLYAKATEILSGKALIPLPDAKEKTYTAKEIGDILGISANMVGRLANQYNLKTSEFGQFFYDKAKHSNKQVETFRYYEKVVPILKSLIHEAKIDKTPQN